MEETIERRSRDVEMRLDKEDYDSSEEEEEEVDSRGLDDANQYMAICGCSLPQIVC